MTTLFQLHSSIDKLKPQLRELAKLWQPQDKLLLLGETLAYVDWLIAYADEINSDEEEEYSLSFTIDQTADQNKTHTSLYALTQDVEQLPTHTQNILGLSKEVSKLTLLSDDEWVALTLAVDKVVTL